MRLPLPPLDMHAHVHPDISARDLEALGAVIFAVTRSHNEAELALARSDRAAVWGVGVHPGLVRAHRAFSVVQFAEQIERSPFVGEVGLDVASRVDKRLQQEHLEEILAITRETPRIVSLHSYGATAALLEVLRRQPNVGAVLHWWLGDAAETAEAIELGCYFSVNPSCARDDWRVQLIPRDRLLTETDHPSGDRWTRGAAQPGNVTAVELAFARTLGASRADVREQVWANFAELANRTKTVDALPKAVQTMLQSR